MNEVNIISPTGDTIRMEDDFGNGIFSAPKWSKSYNSIDYICEPGQVIVAPVDGTINLVAYPFENKEYQAALFENDFISLMIFYFIPDEDKIGIEVKQGDRIGIAQDISQLYNTKKRKMTPHINLHVLSIDPLALMF